VFDADLARAAVALILDGQAPPFEGRVRAGMSEARWLDSPAELADEGMGLLLLGARQAHRPLVNTPTHDG